MARNSQSKIRAAVAAALGSYCKNYLCIPVLELHKMFCWSSMAQLFPEDAFYLRWPQCTCCNFHAGASRVVGALNYGESQLELSALFEKHRTGIAFSCVTLTPADAELTGFNQQHPLPVSAFPVILTTRAPILDPHPHPLAHSPVQAFQGSSPCRARPAPGTQPVKQKNPKADYAELGFSPAWPALQWSTRQFSSEGIWRWKYRTENGNSGHLLRKKTEKENEWVETTSDRPWHKISHN